MVSEWEARQERLMLEQQWASEDQHRERLAADNRRAIAVPASGTNDGPIEPIVASTEHQPRGLTDERRVRELADDNERAAGELEAWAARAFPAAFARWTQHGLLGAVEDNPGYLSGWITGRHHGWLGASAVARALAPFYGSPALPADSGAPADTDESPPSTWPDGQRAWTLGFGSGRAVGQNEFVTLLTGVSAGLRDACVPLMDVSSTSLDAHVARLAANGR